MRIGDLTEPALAFVPVDADPDAGDGPFAYDPALRARVVVDTLHDGDLIPAHLLDNPGVAAMHGSGALARHHAAERDWGADLVARHVAAALGLGGFHRVGVARVVMDFNRFPGLSPSDAGHLERRALATPLAPSLGWEEHRWILERCYDAVSAAMDRAILGALIKLSIHTYDAHNASRTKRPEVSVLARSDSYQRHSRLPWGRFDPLFPDVLAESTAKPILRDRIGLTLEKAGVSVEHNFPYCLPDGSVEIRCQPWFFFQWLRARFEAAHPETRAEPAFVRTWAMLLNTNHRHGTGDALSGYLHELRAAPRGEEAAFEAARHAYDRLRAYLDANADLVGAYRRSPERTSALTIEVRKDLVWRFDDGVPVGPREDEARRIGRVIARAVATYLRVDRAPAL